MYKSRRTPRIDGDVLILIANYFKFCKDDSFVDLRNYVLFRLLSFYGLRISETLSLKRFDFDFSSKVFKIQPCNEKNKQEKVYYLTEEFVLLLKQYFVKVRFRIKNDYIFFSQVKNSEHLSYSGWREKWLQVLMKLNLDFETHFYTKNNNRFRKYRIHSLRVTKITYLLEQNCSVQEVLSLTQHSTPYVVLDIYNRMNVLETQRKILEI